MYIIYLFIFIISRMVSAAQRLRSFEVPAHFS